MSDLNQLVDTVFDMSFLKSSPYMDTDFKTVGILGGGTAGYFAALALQRCHPNLKIQIIESSKIPVIGVGESTTTEIVPFLHEFLGFDPLEFFKEVKPTFKLGIEFDWGLAGDHKFNFNFFAGHQYESYYYDKTTTFSNWPSVLMNHKKMPIIGSEAAGYHSFLTSVPFSYHLENRNLVSYLKKKIQERGIEILDTQIQSANLNSDGCVESLLDEESREYSFDFYIDCSGFRSKLLGESLGTEFVSYSSTLITDKAMTFNLPNDSEIDPFTGAITMKNGWCWKIPMRDEDHYGYVYSSKFCSDEEALAEIEEKFGKIEAHKIVPFKSGRYKEAWNKNVFALGNSYAFIEPLESTAIQAIIQAVMSLCRLMPKSLNDKSSINGLNKEISASWDSFRAFLSVHYKFNSKMDTDFWKWNRENIDLAGAEEIIALFKERAPLSKGHFGNASGYSAYEPLVFNSYSYDSLLFGQDVKPNNMKAPEMSLEEYQARVVSYKQMTELALGQRELFADEQILEGAILAPLFNDYDSWVKETEI